MTKMLTILKVNGMTYMYYFRSLRNQRMNDKNEIHALGAVQK